MIASPLIATSQSPPLPAWYEALLEQGCVALTLDSSGRVAYNYMHSPAGTRTTKIARDMFVMYGLINALLCSPFPLLVCGEAYSPLPRTMLRTADHCWRPNNVSGVAWRLLLCARERGALQLCPRGHHDGTP
jgi:hypothetical protein